jgi:hypothetical protein
MIELLDLQRLVPHRVAGYLYSVDPYQQGGRGRRGEATNPNSHRVPLEVILCKDDARLASTAQQAPTRQDSLPTTPYSASSTLIVAEEDGNVLDGPPFRYGHAGAEWALRWWRKHRRVGRTYPAGHATAGRPGIGVRRAEHHLPWRPPRPCLGVAKREPDSQHPSEHPRSPRFRTADRRIGSLAQIRGFAWRTCGRVRRCLALEVVNPWNFNVGSFEGMRVDPATTHLHRMRC